MDKMNSKLDEDIYDWLGMSVKKTNSDIADIDISDIFGSSSNRSFISEPTVRTERIESSQLFDVAQLFSGISDPGHLTLEDEIDALKGVPNAKTTLGHQSARKTNPTPMMAPIPTVVDEYEETDYGDTYDDYTPAKLRIGIKHPDSVVESSSLSVVSPPDVTYDLSIPEETIQKGWLSSLQLESVVYACQKHQDMLPDQSRAGYLIGDGPGVGKGRIISGIIFENMINKRTKALWISVSNDLRFDATRDLEDIGCDIVVYPLNKIPYADRVEEYFEEYNDVGVLFSTYSSLIGECHSSDALYRSRMDQIIDWLGLDFDGCIILDECHKAKNLLPSGSSKPTKTAYTVLALQKKLPKARVVYCSATGASEPRNMAYMTRLGLWGVGTPFLDFEAFISSVEKRGVGAMELVAIDMKQRGVYLARQLSFTGVSFAVREIPLSSQFKNVYDESVAWWDKAYEYFQRASDLSGSSSRDKSFMLAQFFASHQRFFKTLCISSKVDQVVIIVKNALAHNKAVVIGLQSTGESKIAELMEGNTSTSIVSSAYGILASLLHKHFPMPGFADKIIDVQSHKSAINDSSSDSESLDESPDKKRKFGGFGDGKRFKTLGQNDRQNSILLSAGLKVNKYDFNAVKINTSFDAASKVSNAAMEQCNRMLDELGDWIQRLRYRLPPNTLDDLIDKLGGPAHVAELTGRKHRLVRDENRFIYESRSCDDTPVEMINVKEKDEFMDGNKYVAIISEAASSGISLQSDKRANNKRKRLHITIELSWSADRVIQQFGRTHRSNQLSPPEYLFIISELAGEKRFACVVAKRLESLGALTHGDRRATETRDFSQFNIDNKYGRYALDRMMEILYKRDDSTVDIPPYDGDFLSDAFDVVTRMFNLENIRSSTDASKDRETVKIHKFLNRLLGVKVDLQNAIYQFYTNILEKFVKEAKQDGKYDFGIVDMGRDNETVQVVSNQSFNLRISSGMTSVEIVGVNVERGISFEQARSIVDKNSSPYDGFYISKEPRGHFRQCMLVLTAKSSHDDNTNFYTSSRPNTGFGNKKESLESITNNYYRVDSNLVYDDWTRFYNATQSACSHKYYFGSCKTAVKNGDCDVGKRGRTVYLLCGAIFSLWNILESTFGSSPIKMARVTTVDGIRRIGILIPKVLLDRLLPNLRKIQIS